MAALLGCLVLVVVSAPLYQRSEAVSPEKCTEIPRAPTKIFQQRKRVRDEASETRPSPISSAHFGRAGSAFSPYAPGGAGTSEGVHIAGGTSTSSSAQTEGSAGSQLFPETLTIAQEPWPHACNRCPKSYKHKRSLDAHMKSHEKNSTKCPVCHRMYSKKGNLKDHMKSAHPGAPLPEKESRGRVSNQETGPFICSHCAREYTTIYNRRKHERSHNTLDTHCFQCKKTLSTKANFMSHMQSRHPEEAIAIEEAEREQFLENNPEECGICNKRFKNAESLREHRMSHEGKTKCDECGENLPRRSSLYIHKLKFHKKKKENQ